MWQAELQPACAAKHWYTTNSAERGSQAVWPSVQWKYSKPLHDKRVKALTLQAFNAALSLLHVSSRQATLSHCLLSCAFLLHSLAQARVEAFNAALSELVMYKSRVNVALLQVSAQQAWQQR